MAAVAQVWASASLILRDASDTSVVPAQKAAKPGPVPGPSTVKPKLALSALKSSDTACEMGWTVDEPETLIWPPIPLPAVVATGVDVPVGPPQAATIKAMASGNPRVT